MVIHTYILCLSVDHLLFSTQNFLASASFLLLACIIFLFFVHSSHAMLHAEVSRRRSDRKTDSIFSLFERFTFSLPNSGQSLMFRWMRTQYYFMAYVTLPVCMFLLAFLCRFSINSNSIPPSIVVIMLHGFNNNLACNFVRSVDPSGFFGFFSSRIMHYFVVVCVHRIK